MDSEEFGRRRKDKPGAMKPGSGLILLSLPSHILCPTLLSVVWKDNPHRLSQWAPLPFSFQVDLDNGKPCPGEQEDGEARVFVCLPLCPCCHASVWSCALHDYMVHCVAFCRPPSWSLRSAISLTCPIRHGG